MVSALYWIGKAKAHEGKIDEAKQLTADTIKKYIADPKRDAVEQLITQLAQLCVKKKKPTGKHCPLRQGETRSSRQPAQRRTRAAELDRLLSSTAERRYPPPPKRASFLPKPSWPGFGANRTKRKKTSRRSRKNLNQKT